MCVFLDENGKTVVVGDVVVRSTLICRWQAVRTKDIQLGEIFKPRQIGAKPCGRQNRQLEPKTHRKKKLYKTIQDFL